MIYRVIIALLHAVPCLNGSARLVNDDVNLVSQQPVYDFIKDEVARGRVEVCMNDAFGTVCGVSWDNLDASVLCEELGFSPYGKLHVCTCMPMMLHIRTFMGAHTYTYPQVKGAHTCIHTYVHVVITYIYKYTGAIAVSRRFYGDSSLDAVITNVECAGDESKLLQCSYTRPVFCTSQERDAGAICQDITTKSDNCSDGEIRLVNGTNVLEGRVEVCINRAWGTVCDSTFSQDEASVICNQLSNQTGYRHNGKR